MSKSKRLNTSDSTLPKRSAGETPQSRNTPRCVARSIALLPLLWLAWLRRAIARKRLERHERNNHSFLGLARRIAP